MSFETMTFLVPKNNSQPIQYHAQRQVIAKIELSGKKVLGTNSWHNQFAFIWKLNYPWIEVKWGTNYKASIEEKLELTIKCFNAHYYIINEKKTMVATSNGCLTFIMTLKKEMKKIVVVYKAYYKTW